jgi:hypothetical protein
VVPIARRAPIADGAPPPIAPVVVNPPKIPIPPPAAKTRGRARAAQVPRIGDRVTQFRQEYLNKARMNRFSNETIQAKMFYIMAVFEESSKHS